MNNDNRDYTRVIFTTGDSLVDISGGTPGENYDDGFNEKDKAYNENKKGNKKKIAAIISSVAAVVIVAVGITCVCLFGNFNNDDTKQKEFVFSEGTVVSGVAISGKTFDQAKSLLEAKRESFIKPLTINVDVNGNVAKITESDFNYTYDIEAVLNSIKADTETKDNTKETKTYRVTATVTKESLDKNVVMIADNNDTDPVNAKVSSFDPYSKNRFTYSEAVDGLKVDTHNLENQLKSAIISDKSECEVKAKVDIVKADIDVDNLKKNIVKLASYETVSYNTESGTSNMKVSLKACNGSIIEPGATWSFNNCTGDSNLESNGYKPAAVIVDGKHDIGIGGGICQSSSTIYNAAIRANMEVVERYNHKWASTYVPTGLDATIDYDRLDLKLKNTTKYQMFLECKVVNSTLYASFWGYKSPDYDEIKTANKLTERGSNTYTVKAWRVYLKDGKEIDRESLGSSTYDSSSGYFIDAEYDIGDTDTDVDNLEDTTKPTSSSSSSQASTKPQSSSSSKPTEKPTSKPEPTTNAQTEPQTAPPETHETESNSNENAD